VAKSAFDKIAAGLDDVARFVEGETDGFAIHIPRAVNVRAIRQKLKLSQPKFAETFGFSVGRVRDWEQGRFEVDAPSRAFLAVLDKEPDAVFRALGTKRAGQTTAPAVHRARKRA
jgi:putative transcriptional regulator